MQNKLVKDRQDDEFYTPSKFIEKHIIDYAEIFDKYDKIWIPFSKKEHPMYQIFYKRYGDKVILTPDFCYNEEIGCNDFSNVLIFRQKNG